MWSQQPQLWEENIFQKQSTNCELTINQHTNYKYVYRRHFCLAADSESEVKTINIKMHLFRKKATKISSAQIWYKAFAMFPHRACEQQRVKKQVLWLAPIVPIWRQCRTKISPFLPLFHSLLNWDSQQFRKKRRRRGRTQMRKPPDKQGNLIKTTRNKTKSNEPWLLEHFTTTKKNQIKQRNLSLPTHKKMEKVSKNQIRNGVLWITRLEISNES